MHMNWKSMLALAVTAAVPAMGAAMDSIYAESFETAEDVVLIGNKHFTFSSGKKALFAIRTTESGGETVSMTGNRVHLEAKTDEHRAQTVASYANGTVILGNANSDVSVVAKGNSQVIGLWAVGSESQTKGGQVSVKGRSVIVSAEATGQDEFAYAICANNSFLGSTVPNSRVEINADNIRLEAKANGHEAHALIAMSEGEIIINGNLEARATNAVSARGDSMIRINEDGKHSTRLFGDLSFDFNESTSGTKVNADVVVNLTGPDSVWVGNTTVDWELEANSKLTQSDLDKLLRVDSFQLTVADGALWKAADVKEELSDQTNSAGVAMEGVGYIPLNKLVLNDGVIDLSEGNQNLSVEDMSGKGGTIRVSIDGEGDKLAATRTLNIIDAAKGARLVVTDPSITADDVEDSDRMMAALQSAVLDESETVTHLNTIQEGAIRGEITQIVNGTGEVIQETTETENTKLDAFGTVNAISALTWRHEMNSPGKRLSALRDVVGKTGSWARVYGSEMELGGQDLTNKNTTVELGSDRSVGEWRLGAGFSYTDGSSSYDAGDADNAVYGFSLYGTWDVPCGAYVDVIAKYARLTNDYELNGMEGDFDNNALSLSVETGYRFDFQSRVAFVEPQLGFAYGRIFGENFNAVTNGTKVRVNQADYESLIGRIGLRTGFVFPNDRGTIHARVAGLYDFEGVLSSKASLAQDRTVSQTIREDLGGSWLEFGIGAQLNLTERSIGYLDLERTTGGVVTENWRWNIGFRTVF